MYNRLCLFLLALMLLTGCGQQGLPTAASPAPTAAGPTTAPADAKTASTPADSTPAEEKTEGTDMKLSINGQEVPVVWEQNDATAALQALLADGPLSVSASPYGEFEVVGALGHTLPASDVQTTTQAGDIVLYTGDHIVVFHGSNTWAYTRLGHIEGLDADALRALFGSGDVALVLAAG